MKDGERRTEKKRKKKQLFLGTRVSPPHLFFVSRIFYGNSFLGATFLHNDVDDDSTSICVSFSFSKPPSPSHQKYFSNDKADEPQSDLLYLTKPRA